MLDIVGLYYAIGKEDLPVGFMASHIQCLRRFPHGPEMEVVSGELGGCPVTGIEKVPSPALIIWEMV